jgi:hypothetical protein
MDILESLELIRSGSSREYRTDFNKTRTARVQR